LNWNFSTGVFQCRLPVAGDDNNALLSLLGKQNQLNHIPRLALENMDQVEDELRRMVMRFENREAAFWLIEGQYDQQVFARISIQKINWMMLSAQLQWELTPECTLDTLQAVLPDLLSFIFTELGLHRLELRLVKGSLYEGWPEQLGFSAEGVLPQQQEFEGKDVDLAVYSRLATD
tara:strand:+ start:4043 stop:4570 length:528 start_codon:yes stop_codon:yes gene_type:complete